MKHPKAKKAKKSAKLRSFRSSDEVKVAAAGISAIAALAAVATVMSVWKKLRYTPDSAYFAEAKERMQEGTDWSATEYRIPGCNANEVSETTSLLNDQSATP